MTALLVGGVWVQELVDLFAFGGALDTFGIDPIHFGMIIVINMELALLTPPVGLNLFILASITKAPLAEVIRGITPFAILLLILLIVIMAFPQLSLWLPNLLLG